MSFSERKDEVTEPRMEEAGSVEQRTEQAQS
jgi:hypothetical protein